MTAMDIDFDWVATCLPVSVPNILVSSPPRSNQYTQAAVKRLDTTSWFHCTPRMPPGPGVMHSKLCLVWKEPFLLAMDSTDLRVPQFFHTDGRLRVSVNTANLLDYDWWELENVSLLIILQPF